MDQTRAIQERFGPAAGAYAMSAVHRAGPDFEAMLAAGVRSGRERLLDVGCGAGHTALAFAPRVAEVVALDLTEAMLEQTLALAGERSLSNVAVQRGDAADLPFPNDRFDVVTSRLSAHHYADAQAAVREAARVLAPGGILLLSDTVAPEEPARDTFLNCFELLRDASHVRDYRISEWHAMFREAGFEPEPLGQWSIHQDFEPWVERIGTPAEAVAGLRSLFDQVPHDVRSAFDIRGDGDYDFSLQLALIVGHPAAVIAP
jgi:ubiquinone/menaquinone biosynthesis C-methylase UbiE